MPNPVIDQYGNKCWYHNGQLHRLDGPAIEWASGSKSWYENGQLHRLNGPAADHAGGTRIWYQDGEKHRLNGPAAEYADGDCEWWYNNRLYPFDEWAYLVRLSDEQHMLLQLKYG